MKSVSARIVRGVTLGTLLNCADNTGAKKMEMIGVRTFKGTKRRYPSAGVGDVVMCAVKKGTEKLRKHVVYAVIVRQRKEYRRADGTRIKFEDNAAVLVNPKTFEPQGTEIRSAVAREVVERFTPIGKISSIVV